MTDRHPVVHRLSAAIAAAPCGRQAAWEITVSALLDHGEVSAEALERCAARLEWSAACTRAQSKDGAAEIRHWTLAACS
ncbi:hypothetical protein [Arhodomonas sp. AD133]|uniref:hypothetical protein n=1 Tax=Arhodomonas sp. AD133 TaxID=3415009 RepID=UPI003EB91A46